MISVQDLTTFFGWCLVLNVSVLILMLGMMSIFKEGLSKLNSKIFGVDTEEAKIVFFRLFYQFRMLVFFFNLVPYVVLLIMGG